MNLPAPPDVKLVPEAGDWTKLWSMRLWMLALILGSSAAYVTEHPEVHDLLPTWADAALRWMSGASGFLGMLARVIIQPGLSKP